MLLKVRPDKGQLPDRQTLSPLVYLSCNHNRCAHEVPMCSEDLVAMLTSEGAASVCQAIALQFQSQSASVQKISYMYSNVVQGRLEVKTKYYSFTLVSFGVD